MPAKAVTVSPPHPATVYARTGKGVLSFKNGTAKVSGELEDLFSCVDGKASVANLGEQSEMAAEELEQALATLEKKGYIKVFREGGDQGIADFTEAPDLDFTAPGSLLEISVREAAKAGASAKQRVQEEVVKSPVDPVQAPPSQAEPAVQRDASEARIQELEAALRRAEEASAQMQAEMQAQIATERSARESAEAEGQAVKRARNEAAKALGQAKALAAEERMRAEEQARKLAELEARPPGPEAQTGSMQEALAQAQETVAHVEMQLATERETREKTVQALREAQSGAEAGRNAAEMRVKEMEIALQQAEKVERQNRERLRQVEAQVESGRRARADAEAGLLATAAAAREALQAELTAAKAECEQATVAARQHAERTAQVELEIDTERRARAEAEAKATAERESREKATSALIEIKRVIGSMEV